MNLLCSRLLLARILPTPPCASGLSPAQEAGKWEAMPHCFLGYGSFHSSPPPPFTQIAFAGRTFLGLHLPPPPDICLSCEASATPAAGSADAASLRTGPRVECLGIGASFSKPDDELIRSQSEQPWTQRPWHLPPLPLPCYSLHLILRQSAQVAVLGWK